MDANLVLSMYEIKSVITMLLLWYGIFIGKSVITKQECQFLLNSSNDMPEKSIKVLHHLDAKIIKIIFVTLAMMI